MRVSKKQARAFDRVAVEAVRKFSGAEEQPRVRKTTQRAPINRRKMRNGRLLTTHGSHCAYCGRNLTPKSATRDHVVSKAQGGGYDGNILPACLICNRLKGPLTLEQFREAARTAWEYRGTVDPGVAWRHLFSRFGQFGIQFHCDAPKEKP